MKIPWKTGAILGGFIALLLGFVEKSPGVSFSTIAQILFALVVTFFSFGCLYRTIGYFKSGKSDSAFGSAIAGILGLIFIAVSFGVHYASFMCSGGGC